jgi:hypothetical protein
MLLCFVYPRETVIFLYGESQERELLSKGETGPHSNKGNLATSFDCNYLNHLFRETLSK